MKKTLTTLSLFVNHPFNKAPRPSGTPPLTRRGIVVHILLSNSCFLFSVFCLQAQVNYTINENTCQKISISFIFGALKSSDIQTDEGLFSQIFIEGCGKSSNVGKPQLPVAVNILEVPVFEDYVLNVYGKDFVIYEAKALGINEPVYPAQSPVSKSHTGSVPFIQNKNTYQTDEFYALPLAKFQETGMRRNVNLGTLYVSPVQYNPVTQEIKIYETIDVEILFKKTDLVKTQHVKELHQSPLFRPSNVINPMNNSRVEFSDVPIKYLIVAHSMFRGELDEFITWKKRKGFLVEIGYTDDDNVGTARDSIAKFIKSFYDNATPENPAPTYVLLVGDVEQIPAFIGSDPWLGVHYTDLYYFTWTGGNFPCCYYGRFSAQNVAQLIPQIEKTLQYEQFTMPDPNYLNEAVLVAGYDANYAPTYTNGFIYYATQNYVNATNGYTTVHAHEHPCSSEAAQIRAEIGAGVGLANYTAHCTPNGWSNPGFYTTHISQMNNVNKYGLIIGSCCESNRFNVSECFGEALLRVSGKGAVGYIGASNLTYWDEDYWWSIGMRSEITAHPTYNSANLGAYDRLFHTHGEPCEKWMTTFGSMITAGNESVQVSSTDEDMKKYYWEIYHLMGDPSVMTYLTKPSQMNVQLVNRYEEGLSTITATVAPYAYCAFTNSQKELVVAGFANANGNITFNFDPIETPEKYEFSAWAQGYIQYFKPIYIGVNDVDKTMFCKIYPNPANSTLTIETENFISSYEIIDFTGKVIASKNNMNNNHANVDVCLLAAGIYFVKVIDNEQKSTVQKFVKQ